MIGAGFIGKMEALRDQSIQGMEEGRKGLEVYGVLKAFGRGE